MANLFFLFPLGIIALIIFTIADIMEGKSSDNKGKVVRSVYFYLTSFITLGIVIGSLVFLITLAFQTWVFTEADPIQARIGSPPSLYFITKAEPVREISETVLTCDEECELTVSQKNDIERWQTNYAAWQVRRDNPGAERARGAIAAFSFLIVALPFYLIHFRVVQKDAKKEGASERGVIRNTYFYLVSLASLLMIVITGGILINLALKTWVFPSAGEYDKKVAIRELDPFDISRNGIHSVINCADECELSEETISDSEQWLVDYDLWQQSYQTTDSAQRQGAATLPYILLGIPLFWYHWRAVRRESKKNTDEKIQEENDKS